MVKQLKPRVMQANVCSRCGAQQAKARQYNDAVDFKGLTFDVEGLVETQCGNCGLRWTTQAQDLDNLARIRVVFAAERDAVRQRDGLLTGEQIEAILHELGLNRSQAAVVFGGGPNAFAKYINGEVLQSNAMDRLLRLAQWAGAPAVAMLRDLHSRATQAVTLSQVNTLSEMVFLSPHAEVPQEHAATGVGQNVTRIFEWKQRA